MLLCLSYVLHHDCTLLVVHKIGGNGKQGGDAIKQAWVETLFEVVKQGDFVKTKLVSVRIKCSDELIKVCQLSCHANSFHHLTSGGNRG